MIEFELKTKVKIGECEYLNLPKYIEELKYKKLGLIVDKKLKGIGYVDEIIDKICKEFSFQIFYYGFNEPTYEQLDAVNETFSKEKIDAFIGIGGGSVIDFSKGLAVLSTNPGKALQYRGFPTDINPPKPVIAVPTTAGTGAEVTYNAVFVDAPAKKKLGINTKLNFPVLAILDPLLIISAPKRVILSSGLDGLVHAVESYGTKRGNELTQFFSRKALDYLYHGMIDFTLWDELDRESRIKTASKLQIGAYLGGIALMNSGAGPAGAFSYILGTLYNIPHGLAGGVFLPHLIEFNESKYFRYTDAFDDPINFKLLFNMLDFDFNDLKQFGVTPSNIEVLLKGIETVQATFDLNPVPFTVEDAKKIIKGMV